ncbi:type I-E CRISPR-associated protein Cas6/Cse3/CasE [Thermomicrobium sp.]
MFLTRFLLNPRHPDVQRDLADCYRLHRRVLSLFPDLPTDESARRALGVLYRPEGYVLLVQSRIPPQSEQLPSGYLLETAGDPLNPSTKDVSGHYDRVVAGMQLTFRLRANPTRKIDSWREQPGYRPNGRRVDLRRVEDQLTWLVRKGEQHGFRVLSVRVRDDTVTLGPQPLQADARPAGKVVGWRPASNGAGQKLTFAAVVYDGVLRVTDPIRFREALESGIGPAKAFGFGLLSIAPVKR